MLINQCLKIKQKYDVQKFNFKKSLTKYGKGYLLIPPTNHTDWGTNIMIMVLIQVGLKIMDGFLKRIY